MKLKKEDTSIGRQTLRTMFEAKNHKILSISQSKNNLKEIDNFTSHTM